MTQPKTESQLNDLLNDPQALAQAIRDAVGESTKDIVNDALKAHGIKRLPMGGIGPNPDAEGADLDGKFARFGDFLKSVYGANRGNIDPRLKVLNEGDGQAGGYTVPEEFRATLLATAIEGSVVRPRAFTIPMTSETLQIPALQDADHSTGVYGGVVAYWEPESGTLTASEPKFGRIGLRANKLTGYTTASNELLADSAVGLEALIIRLFGDALRFEEDEAFINGTGAGQPLGLLNAPAKVTVAKEGAQAAATIVLNNLAKMYSRMLPSSINRAVWLAHPDTFPQLAILANAGNNPVWMANVVGGPPSSIYGRPVIFTEHCQTLGTEGDIYFVDLGYYIVGDRQALTVAASPHVRFVNDETVWRFTERLDGQLWLQSAITPAHGSNTISPLISLAVRA